jgi:hypothetical protein
VTGYPVTSGAVKGVLTLNGGTGVLQFSNLDALTPYVVGSNPDAAAFTTIQSAINQAVADGASATTPAVVYVTPGIYTEDLTLADYVHMAGTGSPLSCQIFGSSIYAGVGSWSAINLSWNSTTSSAALSLQSTSTSTVTIQTCNFNSGSASGIGLECTGSGITAQLSACTAVAQAGGRCKNITAGSLEFFSSFFTFTDTASTISGGSCFVVASEIFDSYTVTTGGTLYLTQVTVDSGTLPCVAISSTSLFAAFLINSIMESDNASGYFVSGTGSVVYSNLTCIGGATTIDPGITQHPQTALFGNFSFDGGFTTLSGDGQVWIGSGSGIPIPTTLTAGTGITITNAPNSITIASSGTSAPVSSATATSGFGALVVGTSKRNTLGYDIQVNISLSVTAATGAAIDLGVGPATGPTTNPVTGTLAAATTISFSAIVPNEYYILVNTTGTITIGSITTQVCPL